MGTVATAPTTPRMVERFLKEKARAKVTAKSARVVVKKTGAAVAEVGGGGGCCCGCLQVHGRVLRSGPRRFITEARAVKTVQSWMGSRECGLVVSGFESGRPFSRLRQASK